MKLKNLIKTIKARDPFQWWLKFTINPIGGFLGGKTGRFSRGAFLTISLTTKCPMRHWYCPLMLDRENYPKFPECSIEEWIEFIEKFPEHVSYVGICGGEPTLVKGLSELTNHLLNSGRKVCIFTNLWNIAPFQWMQASSRLQIQATYHHDDNPARFTNAYSEVTRMGHKVDAVEIDNEPQKLSFTKLKSFLTPEYLRDIRQFHASPVSPKTRAIYTGMEKWYTF
jgi:organic radical activating enzyme